MLGTAAGGLIIITNTRTFLNGIGVPSAVVTTVLVVLAVAWIAAIVVAVRSARRGRAEAEGAPARV